MYKIKYLPIARQDIIETIQYIAEKLQAPQAAHNLMNELTANIKILEKSPYIYRVYQLPASLKYEYRAMPVKNYIIFYTVLEKQKTVEIHRMIYNKRNMIVLLEKNDTP